MSSAPQIRYLKEPSYKEYRALETDLLENDEYYIYQINDAQVVRRKVGGWVNLYSLFPLIDEKFTKLEQRVDEFPVSYAKTRKDTPERFYGVYTPLEIARDFAKEYEIYDLVAPILSFNRVALVTYMGSLFYEYFATSRYDSQIRILRECNETVNERINMDQIFVAYRKHKGEEAIPELERSFHTYYTDILKKGDPTLCGGSWVHKDVVMRFTKKHGFYNLLSPIIDFQGNDPSTGHEYPIDIIQRDLGMYWKVTASDDGFYGFPFSFKGGHAANRPRGNAKTFAFAQLCAEKKLHIETTKQDKSYRRSLTLLRRLSDGYVNVSYLVSIGVLLKLNELNLGEEDPDLLTANELYQRDRLERLPCETVTTSASKYANGQWCSVTVARNLFASFHVKKDNNERRKVHDFLYSKEFAAIEKDTDGTLLSDRQQYEDDSDDELAPIAENDFRKLQNDEKEPIYYDETFFEDDAPALPEDRIAPADFNDYHDGQRVESQEEDDIEYQGSSKIQDDEEDEAYAQKDRKRMRSGKKRKVFDSSDEDEDDGSGDSNKRPKSSSMFVDPVEESEEQVNQDGDDENEDGIDSLFGTSQPSTGNKEPESNNENQQQAPGIDPRLAELERQERADDTTRALKDLAFQMNECLRENFNSRKVGLRLKGLFSDLGKYRAIDETIKINSNINQTLKRAKTAANAYTRQAESILSKWRSEVADGELPGKPGDPVKKTNVVNDYDQLRSSKVPPPPPPQPYGRRPFGNEQAPPPPPPPVHTSHQGPPIQGRPYQGPSGPQPPQQYNNYYQQNNPSPQNQYHRPGPVPGPSNRPYPNQYMPQHGGPPPPQPRYRNQPGPPIQPGQPIPPGQGPPRPRPQPNYHGAPPSPQPNFRGSPPIRNPAPQRHQPVPRVSPSIPQPSQPIYVPPPTNKPTASPIYVTPTPPQPIPMNSPHHYPPQPSHSPPQQQRNSNSGGASPNLSFIPPLKRPAPTGPSGSNGPQGLGVGVAPPPPPPQPAPVPRSITPTADYYQPPIHQPPIPNPQNKYRERTQGQTYIPQNGVTGGRLGASAFPHKYKRTGTSTSASPKNRQKEASNTIIKEIQRPLSPPSNYLNLPNEPLDIIDLALQDYEEMVNEAKLKTAKEEAERNDEFNELKKITHFETRTKQDLFKRAKIFYENEKRRVGFTKRLHAMMSEAYARRQRQRSESKV